MAERRVEVLPDLEATDGGRAIIRLNGIYHLPADAAFRLEPIDRRINGTADPGWPGGERRPNGSRLGPTGIEIEIGPDIVEARLLAPGTPVLISIPMAAIKEQITWPDIVHRQRRSRRALLPPPGPPERGRSIAVTKAPHRGTLGRTADLASAENVHPESEVPTRPAKTVGAATASPGAYRPGLAAPFAIGFFLAFAFGTSVWLAFDREITGYVNGLTRPPETAATLPASRLLTDIAGVGDVSPRGISATGIDLHGAVLRARMHLAARSPDIPETRFWLRTALSRAMANADVKWSLTELGKLNAANGLRFEGYTRAQVLWEIAAANGDPDALCLLAALHEKGLGTAVDQQRAKSLRADAAKRGGCRDLTATGVQQSLTAPEQR